MPASYTTTNFQGAQNARFLYAVFQVCAFLSKGTSSLLLLNFRPISHCVSLVRVENYPARLISNHYKYTSDTNITAHSNIHSLIHSTYTLKTAMYMCTGIQLRAVAKEDICQDVFYGNTIAVESWGKRRKRKRRVNRTKCKSTKASTRNSYYQSLA